MSQGQGAPIPPLIIRYDGSPNQEVHHTMAALSDTANDQRVSHAELLTEIYATLSAPPLASYNPGGGDFVNQEQHMEQIAVTCLSSSPLGMQSAPIPHTGTIGQGPNLHLSECPPTPALSIASTPAVTDGHTPQACRPSFRLPLVCPPPISSAPPSPPHAPRCAPDAPDAPSSPRSSPSTPTPQPNYGAGAPPAPPRFWLWDWGGVRV